MRTDESLCFCLVHFSRLNLLWNQFDNLTFSFSTNFLLIASLLGEPLRSLVPHNKVVSLIQLDCLFVDGRFMGTELLQEFDGETWLIFARLHPHFLKVADIAEVFSNSDR